jgi:regulator of sigma E protease
MPDIVIAILAVLFVFGVAINIHEFGHFIVGKMFGMRIEAYSFFGIGKMIWKFRRGHTDYGIAMFPVGAYVKFYGDEATAGLEGGSSVGEDVPKEELFEFRPRWQKFLVMLGGPLMNIILALAIPFGMAWVRGVPSSPPPIVAVIAKDGAAEKAGIKVGDRVVNFEGVENPSWDRIKQEALLIPEKQVPITVEREGQRVNLMITPTKVTENGQPAGFLDMNVDAGVFIGNVEPNTPAQEAGLQRVDRILSINGEKVESSQAIKDLVQKYKENPLKITVERQGKIVDVTASVRKLSDGTERLGIGFEAPLEPATLVTATAYAFQSNWDILRMTAKALGQVRFFGQAEKGERSVRDTVSGPIGIVQIIAQMATTAGFAGLLFLLGLISLNLGVMNLLPIPLLDGGQIVLLGIEKVLSWFGKTMSVALRDRINMTGFAILILLMAFTTFNDIAKFFR